MAKAQINFPDGTTVKLEGTPEEISAVVDRARKAPPQTGRAERAGKGKAKPQLVDHIANLIDGGFFKKTKELAAVKGAWRRWGTTTRSRRYRPPCSGRWVAGTSGG